MRPLVAVLALLLAAQAPAPQAAADDRIWSVEITASLPPPWPVAPLRLPDRLPALLNLPEGPLPEGTSPEGPLPEALPVVVLLGDAAAFGDRLDQYAPMLLAEGMAVVAIDSEGARGVDVDGPVSANALANAAETLSDALTALQALRGNAAELRLAPWHLGRIGLLGIGTGGEAAVLASFERALTAFGVPGFDAIAAVTPSCGHHLAAALRAGETPAATPMLLVEPWAETPNPSLSACAGLSDMQDPALRERVSVLTFDWPLRYGYDLPARTRQEMLPHPTGEGLIRAVPEPGAAALTRFAVARFFALALGR